MLGSVLLFLASSIAAQTNASDPLVISTNVGTFAGQYVSPDVRSWLGIRYGQPTNGTLRFRPPRRAKVIPQGTIYNASSFSPSCGQLGGTNTSDDCLSINIWSPANASTTNLTPVMIWIYGGGFVGGSNSLAIYNGSNFVQNQGNITIVSLNYRLTAFGFPAGSPLGPLDLNAGLEDQRLAVEWVYNNIRNFGGDPEQITLFGESAGAESIGLWPFAYEFDPIAKGMILESGSEFLLGGTQAFFNANLTNRAWQAISNATGCGLNASTTANEQFTCMQNADFSVLQSAVSGYSGSRNFLPTVDSRLVFSGTDYLARNQNGSFAKLPILLGTNNNEGTTLVGSYAAGSGGSQFAIDFITKFSFTCPAAQVATSRTNSSVPVWQYRYFLSAPGSAQGAFHGSEITSVFGTYNMTNATLAQQNTSAIMQSAWVAFARDPQNGLNAYGWPQYQANGTTLIEISKNYYNTTTAILNSDLPVITFNNSQTYNIECGSGYSDVPGPSGSSSSTTRKRSIPPMPRLMLDI